MKDREKEEYIQTINTLNLVHKQTVEQLENQLENLLQNNNYNDSTKENERLRRALAATTGEMEGLREKISELSYQNNENLSKIKEQYQALIKTKVDEEILKIKKKMQEEKSKLERELRTSVQEKMELRKQILELSQKIGQGQSWLKVQSESPKRTLRVITELKSQIMVLEAENESLKSLRDMVKEEADCVNCVFLKKNLEEVKIAGEKAIRSGMDNFLEERELLKEKISGYIEEIEKFKKEKGKNE